MAPRPDADGKVVATRWDRYRQEGVHRAIVSVLGWVSLLTTLLIG